MKKIYIDPGHSKSDTGAVGYAVERDLNEKVAKYMNDYLQANYVCETKVDPVTNNSLSKTTSAANNWKADLFVSIHFNAGGGDGFECFIYSDKHVDLGKIFAKHVKAAGQNLRSSSVAPGVKIRPGLYVLSYTNMTAILTEGAFVDNKKDIQNWNEDVELKKLGIAYAEAAAEFLKLEKKNQTQTKPEKTEHTYYVQAGPYSNKKDAENMVTKLKAENIDAIIVEGKPEETWTPKVGDTVKFTGNKQYSSSDSDTIRGAIAGVAKITVIAKGKKHPYHLVRTGSSGPYGWVDAETFTKV